VNSPEVPEKYEYNQTPKEIVNLLDTLLLLGSNYHRRNVLFIRALRF
jgi:hypothetical protein